MNSKQSVLLLSLVALLALAACDPPTSLPLAEIDNVVAEDQKAPPLFLASCDENWPKIPPSAVYPAANEIVSDLQPEMKWLFGLECEPNGYQLTINDVNTAMHFEGVGQSKYDIASENELIFLEPAHLYWWNVCETVWNGGAVCFKKRVPFYTGPVCEPGDLVAPTLIFPADGSIYTGKSWGNVYEVETDITYPSGNCIPEDFTIYISESADFSTPTLNVYSPGAIFSENSDGPLLVEDDSNDVPDCTQLYWKAWATVDSVNGPESEVFSFYTDIEGNCFVPLPWEDIFYIELPQDANCRASDVPDSRNIGTLNGGEQFAVLAINPEGTHVRVMESKFDVKCWAWLGVVDLMKGNEIIDPSIVLELGPIVDPVEPPVEEPAGDGDADQSDDSDDEQPTGDGDADQSDDSDDEQPAQCSDGIDNDGDGAIDYGDTAAIASGKADRQCSSPDDDSESN